jgi:hypothetical protein
MEKIPMTPQKAVKEEEFLCENCKQMLEDPIVLDCLHSICLKCAKQIADENLEKNEIIIECKICKDRGDWTVIPGIKRMELEKYLQPDIIIKEKARDLLKNTCLDDALKKTLKQLSGIPEEEICHLHNEPFTHVCCNEKCEGKKCCEKCTVEHVMLHIKNGDKNISFQDIEIQGLDYCTKHKNNENNFYCLSCESLCCLKCLHEETHKDHIWDHLQAIKEKYVAEIKKIKKNFVNKQEYAEKIRKDFELGLNAINNQKEKKRKLVQEQLEKNQKTLNIVSSECIEKLEEEKKMKDIEIKKFYDSTLKYSGKLENASKTIKELEAEYIFKCNPKDLEKYLNHLVKVSQKAIEGIGEIC